MATEKKVSQQERKDRIWKAAKAYADALKAAIENPLPENSQKVLEASRRLNLEAASIIPQDVLMKLGQLQRDNVMSQ